MAVLQSLISRLGKGKGKMKKYIYYNTGYSYLVTQPSTNPAQQGFTLLSGRSMLLSLVFAVVFAVKFNKVMGNFKPEA